MSPNKPYALAARFATPKQLLGATEELKALNLNKWDANTPYPLHGLDESMGARPSQVPWLTFFNFAIVISLVFAFIYWVSCVDYPINYGGKPYFSFLAWVPILFELTVITSVVVTLFGTIFFFWRLPFFNHPLADSQYLNAVVSDSFGVYVQYESQGFDEAKIRAIYQKYDAIFIESIVPTPDTPMHLPLVGNWRESYTWLALPLVALFVSCFVYTAFNLMLWDRIPWLQAPFHGHSLSDIPGFEKAKRTPFTWLDYQDKEKTQGHSNFFANGAAMRPHPEGTIARNFLPEDTSKVMNNPIPITEANLKQGQKQFGIYCAVCHGKYADGDGRVPELGFPKPPSLHSDKLSQGPDQLIYNIISHGQNNMPALDKQISREDRWKIVHYVRALQRAKNAKDTDLP